MTDKGKPDRFITMQFDLRQPWEEQNLIARRLFIKARREKRKQEREKRKQDSL